MILWFKINLIGKGEANQRLLLLSYFSKGSHLISEGSLQLQYLNITL